MTDAERKMIDSSSKEQIVGGQTAEDDWHRIAEIGLRFCDDKIVRAGPISEWLWGEWLPRKCYHLAETTRAYPFFQEGSQLAIRKSTVRAYIWAQEKKAFSGDQEERLVRLAILLSKLLELVRESKASADSGRADTIHLWMALLQKTSEAIDAVLRSE